MRVLIAPDKFAGTLTAVEAAEAIATGWRRHAPDDELDLAPMADGGPGFVDVLHAALGGELLAVTAEGPHGERVPAAVLRVGDVAYVETAQVVGLHLIEGGAEFASTTGVGELILAAVDGGATTVVLGLGGSGTNDGGAGVLASLGATSDGILDSGAIALDTGDPRRPRAGTGPPGRRPAGRRHRRRQPTHRALRGDQDLRPAEGHRGGPHRRGRRLARVVRGGHRPAYVAGEGRRRRRRHRVRAARSSGATREPGHRAGGRGGLPGRRVRRRPTWSSPGEGAFDFSSRSGKVPYGVAGIASEALRPCVALAGQVLVGSREMRALGIESAYSLVDLVGEERAFAAPRRGAQRARGAGGPVLVALRARGQSSSAPDSVFVPTTVKSSSSWTSTWSPLSSVTSTS